MLQARPLAIRHPGYDVEYNEASRLRLGRRVRGARWLTFAGKEITDKLGGRAGLRGALSNAIAVEPLGSGLIIRAGELPELGDVDKGIGVPLLREVAAALEPVPGSTTCPCRKLRRTRSGLFRPFGNAGCSTNGGSAGCSTDETRVTRSEVHHAQNRIDLPFSVTHPTQAFFSSGQNVTVVVRLRDDVRPDAADRVSAAMKLFVDLAGCGALAGQAIEPWRSGVVARPRGAGAQGALSFLLEQCRSTIPA